MDFAVLPFSKELNQLGREEEDSGVSPRSTGNVNYPKELFLVHDCASAHSVSVSQCRLHGLHGICVLAQGLWSLHILIGTGDFFISDGRRNVAEFCEHKLEVIRMRCHHSA